MIAGGAAYRYWALKSPVHIRPREPEKGSTVRICWNEFGRSGFHPDLIDSPRLTGPSPPPRWGRFLLAIMVLERIAAVPRCRRQTGEMRCRRKTTWKAGRIRAASMAGKRACRGLSLGRGRRPKSQAAAGLDRRRARRPARARRTESGRGLLRRLQFALKPAPGLVGFERIEPVAFGAFKPAQPVAVTRRWRTAVRTARIMNRLPHAGNLRPEPVQVHSKCNPCGRKFDSGNGGRSGRRRYSADRAASCSATRR
jgi:hypothetical protein